MVLGTAASTAATVFCLAASVFFSKDFSVQGGEFLPLMRLLLGLAKLVNCGRQRFLRETSGTLATCAPLASFRHFLQQLTGPALGAKPDFIGLLLKVCVLS